MSETAYSRTKRDQRVADEVGDEIAAEATLRCIADGCPSRWSVDAGRGRLCSAHAWAAARDWPAITDHARALAEYGDPQRADPVPVEAVTAREALTKLRAFLADRGRQSDPRRWAKRLRYIEQHRDGVMPRTGLRMTPAQREAWRAVLPEHDEPAAADDTEMAAA